MKERPSENQNSRETNATQKDQNSTQKLRSKNSNDEKKLSYFLQ